MVAVSLKKKKNFFFFFFFFSFFFFFFIFFFFQAEDGIRDLVRSRGLGDVYKRQGEIDLSYINKALSIRKLYIPVGDGILAAQGGMSLSLIHI